MGLKFLSLFLVVLLSGFVMAATYTVTTPNFNVPWGEEVTGGSFVAVNNTPDVRVRINGDNQGTIEDGVSMSFNKNDFNAYFNWWNWVGNNQITFNPAGGVDSFTLTYTTQASGSGNGDDGDWCNNNNQCSGDCVFHRCCSAASPIKLESEVATSCPASYIPITIDMDCSDADWDDYKNIPVKITLGNIVIHPNCNVSGDSGWALNGKDRCGALIPDTMAPGNYVLKANYTVDGVFKQVILNPAFSVTADCSTSTTCGHGGASQAVGLTNVVYSGPFESTGQMVLKDGVYIVPYNGASVSITGIGAIQTQCSNGVGYSIIPGFVAWTTGSASSTTKDSLVGCDVTGVTREAVFNGPNSNDGYRSTGCGLSLTRTNSPSLVLHTFDDGGNYDIDLDMINAICDSPSYICPDRVTSDTGNGICGIGTMAYSAANWFRQDGWNGNKVSGTNPYRQYSFKAAEPGFSATKVSSSQNNLGVIDVYNFTNTGFGDTNLSVVSPAGSDYRFRLAGGNSVLISEGQSLVNTVEVLLNNPVNRSRSNIVTSYGTNYTLSSFNYTEYVLNNYTSYSFVGDQLIVNYNILNPLYYDDGYGFSSIVPTREAGNMTFNFALGCSLNSHYVVNLKGTLFECISDIYWSDMNWKNTSNADLGDSVKLMYTNTRLAPGTEVNFEVYYKDGSNNRSIRTGASALKGIVDSGENVYTYWIINKSDLDKTTVDEGDPLNNFYFVVKNQSSGMLKVDWVPSDAPMDITVVSPKCSLQVYEGANVPVNVTAFDVDSLILGMVTIEEPTSVRRSNFTNGGTFFNYNTLGNSGNVQVVAYGANERNYVERTISSIMVVSTARSDSYVAACIDKPADLSDVGSGDVEFLANSSRGLRYAHPSGLLTNVSKSDLNFFWKFSDGRVNPITDGANTRSYEFHKTFIEGGRNWASLEVGFKG